MLDIEKCNKKKKNLQLNKTLQNFMYTMLRDSSQQASRESLAVMIELWRKRVWYVFFFFLIRFLESSYILGMTIRL